MSLIASRIFLEILPLPLLASLTKIAPLALLALVTSQTQLTLLASLLFWPHSNVRTLDLARKIKTCDYDLARKIKTCDYLKSDLVHARLASAMSLTLQVLHASQTTLTLLASLLCWPHAMVQNRTSWLPLFCHWSSLKNLASLALQTSLASLTSWH